MMEKEILNSQSELILEDLSDEAAEAISGGQELVLAGDQELTIDLFSPLTMPFDLLSSVTGSASEAIGALSEIPGLGQGIGLVTGLTEGLFSSIFGGLLGGPMNNG